ncbi:MAG TPA: GGDEF domain-containing protein [Gemmatimonadales bacterium]|jgi:diguanylate cyclase (GGDEF)-like protein|nr:GGDEF domain-containing protein [Gemmatimonadales bacterium]
MLPVLIGVALVALAALAWAVAALRRALARERTLARTDDVTGVRSARAFRETASAEIERARRYQHPFTVACVDLGYRVSDDVLRSAAGALRGALRASDTVARLGRDEFIVLLPETPSPAARVVLEKLRTGLTGLRMGDGRQLAASIGGVTFLNAPGGMDDIIRATDERIAEAKATGNVSHVTWNAAPEGR